MFRAIGGGCNLHINTSLLPADRNRGSIKMSLNVVVAVEEGREEEEVERREVVYLKLPSFFPATTCTVSWISNTNESCACSSKGFLKFYK